MTNLLRTMPIMNEKLGPISSDAASRLIGNVNKSAGSYWERVLSMEEASNILRVRLSVFRSALASGILPDGRPCPRAFIQTTAGAVHFRGQDIFELANGVK